MPLREFQFRGHRYLVSCVEAGEYQHPTWFSFIDEQDVREAHWDIKPGDCVFDVGAAYGSYTLTALAAGASRAFAWSPQGMPGEEGEAVVLRRSLAENGWSGKCDVHDWGVYDRAGFLNAQTQEFSADEPTAPWPSDLLRVRTLDGWYREEFLKRHWRDEFLRYWMKLDVEGAEVEVLRAAAEMIRDLKPRIFVELHKFKRPNVEQEVIDVLGPLGYEMSACAPYHSVAHALFLPHLP